MAHRLVGSLTFVVQDEGSFPENESAVALERCHTAHHPVVHEGGDPPFHRLFDFRAGGANYFTNVCENRLREILGLRDVRVNARVTFGHAGYNCEMWSRATHY